MGFSCLTMATSAAALSAKGNQTGGNKRAFDFELLDARLQMTGDQGGMFGDFHEPIIANQGAGMAGAYIYVSGLARKK
jgi:hypothetical protein